MVITSGVNYGLAKTLPYILGIIVSKIIMNTAFALGLGSLFQLYPGVLVYLKAVACAYLLWLSWRIAFNKVAITGKAPKDKDAPPPGFMHAALFQLVNPKGLVASTTVVTLFVVPEQLALSTFAIVTVFASAHIFSKLAWTVFGVALQKFLAEPSRLRVFNFCMGALLVLAILPIALS